MTILGVVLLVEPGNDEVLRERVNDRQSSIELVGGEETLHDQVVDSGRQLALEVVRAGAELPLSVDDRPTLL
jgi:hypothetical protein